MPIEEQNPLPNAFLLSREKTPRRQIEKGQARAAAAVEEGGQAPRFPRVEEGGIEGRSRRDDAHDLAADDPLRLPGSSTWSQTATR